MDFNVLDVFSSSAFSTLSMTAAINKIPFVPGRAGVVIDWNEGGVSTTSIAIEEKSGTLRLIDPTPRGGAGQSVAKDKRKMRDLRIPHYQIDDAIYAEEVQNVREFGQSNVLQTVQSVVDARMADHVQLVMDPTLEHQRIGAVKGIITDGSGNTIYNLFTEFGVSQPSEVAFDLTNGSPASGAVRRVCTGVVRTIKTALGGTPVRGIYAFCGDAFWDDLIANKEVRETYLNQQDARELRGGVAYETLDYGGIIFENYQGSVNGTAFVNTDKCHIFPVGVPGLWRTHNAPADYMETVNTIGLPRYSKQFRMQDDKGVSLQMQANSLSLCTRPGVLVQGKRSA